MQRTRDLAILKAIGASNAYLLKDALGMVGAHIVTRSIVDVNPQQALGGAA